MKGKGLAFYKMSGSGNDFIIIDNRDGSLLRRDLSSWIRAVCHRQQSVGADGLILIERSSPAAYESEQADFRWRFFNADGGEVDMCGNGGRCVARLAHHLGIAGPSLSFETRAGIVKACVEGNRVRLQMPDPRKLEMDVSIRVKDEVIVLDSIIVGVPHAVVWTSNIETAPVVSHGRAIRYHEAFSPEGTNANFAQVRADGAIWIRTYERGVEDETLACGTGSVATALIAAKKGMVRSPVVMHTRGGEELKIFFEQTGDGFAEVFLDGEARIIYEGQLWDEATEFVAIGN